MALAGARRVTPYLGATVLVNVDAARNNGSPVAPATVTRLNEDGTLNVRVLYDAPPSHYSRHRPEHLTDVTFHDTTDPAAAMRHGQYGAFWPDGPDLATIICNEERIMSGLTDLQAAVTAQGTAITAMQAEWTAFLADLTTALGNEDSDAAVEAASQLVTQQTASITAQTAAMVAADPVSGTAATSGSSTTTTVSGGSDAGSAS